MLLRNDAKQSLIFLRMVQGSRGAPLRWARLAALLMRLTQSLFDPDRLRLLGFVDDPIAGVTGTKLQGQLCVATSVLTWDGKRWASHWFTTKVS